MMGTMFTGMAFGAGSEVAHQGVRGLMGSNNQTGDVQTQAQAQTPEQTQQQTQAQTNNCQMETTNFVDCIKFNSNNISSCQDYLNLLKACEQKYK